MKRKAAGPLVGRRARLHEEQGEYRMGTSKVYAARHAMPSPTDVDTAALARQRVDSDRAERAVIVLAATDGLEASRVLYRALLLAGALHPRCSRSVSARSYVESHELAVAS